MATNWNSLNLIGSSVEFFQDFADGLNAKDISFPDFTDSNKLIIACDYSGEHKDSNYFTVSFIIADFYGLTKFDQGRLYIRKKHSIGGRRFEYKKIFRDGVITKGLTGFLRSVDAIPGILLSFSINKEIEGIFENIKEIKDENKIFEDWNVQDLGKLLWTVHLGSFFIAGLSNKFQNVHWLSDRDNIVANLDRKKATAGYFGNILSMYLPHSIQDFALVVPEDDERVLDAEDLLSIPDLAGGALADIESIHQKENNYPKSDGEIVPVSDSVKEKSSFLANWLAENNCLLQKLFFRLDYNDNKTIIDYNRTYFK
jgi:hypothetical protein